MESQEDNDAKRQLASLNPDALDRLAELVTLKLRAVFESGKLFKQVVAGSNQVSRSTILNLTQSSLAFA